MKLLDRIIFKLSKKLYIKRFIKKNHTNMRYKKYGCIQVFIEDIYCYDNIHLTYDSFNIENGKYNHFFSNLDRNLNYKKINEPINEEILKEYYDNLYPLFQKIILNSKLESKLPEKQIKIGVKKI